MKKNTQIFVRISPELKARFDRVCRKNCLNQSALMRSWIEEFVRKEERRKMKKYVANLKDENGYIVTGYEQVLSADSREEAIADYLYWLNTGPENENHSPKEVDLVEVDWED